ncbi:MAG: hypothetical protein IJS91_00200 [Bacteroidales bacterium]|nr:hypothetical protein [Bacteroidales bacterium]
MKKLVYIFSLLALVLCAYSCQNSIDTAKESLTITATIAEPDASRVALTDNGETLRPEWSVGDKVIGFDEEGDTFEFTVESITDRRATMNAGGYAAVNGRKVYAIYAPGYEKTAISDKKLVVSIESQNGGLDMSQPFLMCATATVEGSNINLVFENQIAVVGLKKFKINPVDAATNVDHLVLNGAVASGTFQLVDSKLQLVPSGSPAPITADGTWTTDASGVYDNPVYFAVLPTTGANLELHAVATNDKYVNLASIPETTLNAGYYYRMSKILDAVADVDGVKYDSIDAAWAAANAATSDVTVTLLANCSAAAQLALNNTGSGAVTLDLNNKTLTTISSNDGISIGADRELIVNNVGTLKNVGATASNSYVIYNEGTLTVNNGTITSDYRAIRSSGTTAINAGTVESTNSVVSNAYAFYNTGALTVTGGVFTAKRFPLFNTESSSTAEISGGTFSSTRTDSGGAAVRAYNGTVTITGGLFSMRYSQGDLFTVSSGKVYVSGGYFDRPIIGSMTRTAPDNGTYYNGRNKLNAEDATKEEYPFTVDVKYSRYYKVTVSGVDYYHKDLASASRHSSLAVSDIIITLLNNCSETGSVALTNAEHSITLDLNNHTLSTSVSKLIQTQGTLIITDNSVAKGGTITSSSTYVLYLVGTESNVTISNCKITSTYTGTGSYYYNPAVVYQYNSDSGSTKTSSTLSINNAIIYTTGKMTAVSNLNGTLEVTDSEISAGTSEDAADYDYVAVCNYYGSTIIHSGCLYSNSSKGTRPPMYLASGTGSVSIEGGYFWGGQRSIRAGNLADLSKFTLSGGFYNCNPEFTSSGTTYKPTYADGFERKTGLAGEYTHSVKGTLSFTYGVAAKDPGEAEAQASTSSPVASYGAARTGGVSF